MLQAPRARSGPLPDPYALRREYDGKDWIRLPEKGRTGDTPEWPAEFTDPSVMELHLWERLWKMPQACIWETGKSYDQVALYTRTLIMAGRPEAPSAKILLAKQLGEALLLSTMALRAAKTIIKGGDEEAALDSAKAARQTTAAAKRAHPSVKDRLKIAPALVEETEE